MSLPSGLTPQQVIQGLTELADLGLDAIGQSDLAVLVNAASKIAQDGLQLLAQQSPAAVLTAEVDAEQAAAVAAGEAKFGKP